MSSDYSEQEKNLREQVQQSERKLDGLERDLCSIDAELEVLAERHQQYELLSGVCRSLEELESLGGAHLFWDGGNTEQIQADRLEYARRKIDEFGEEVAKVESRREAILDKIGTQNTALDYLHYDLQDVIEQEESRRNEWLLERDEDELPYRAQVMPWTRGVEEDQRLRKSMLSSLAAAIAIAMILSMVALPIIDSPEVLELPERMAKLVRKDPPPPPPPVQQPEIPEELPEPEPAKELVEELVPDQPKVAEVPQPDTREQVKSKGILAFRDSFANRAEIRPTAQLGSQARLRNAGENSVGRPERMMVTTSAPGSSGGINLASISRDFGGGGGGMEGVAVSRVSSSIGGGEGPDRPFAGGAAAGRTDEEIQIVFDRYKAALYRMYNRELRKDPTLRGQLVLQLTIEPDGSVSLCELFSSDMEAPLLAAQVVDRVKTFDFGAKEDIVAVTIIYPIDFLPAA
ncbi:MAG: AgmX/PglI C-terminal domain-containing protein [Woeseiaceae bacterium]|nr:AgmX/PglI C-terminal domain-containing protein [Woeseiaceae bacterium]